MMLSRNGLLMALCAVAVALGACAAEEESKGDKQLKAADKLVKTKDYEAALVILDSLLKETKEDDPLFVQTLCQKAGVLEQEKKTAEALEAYNRCLEILVDAPDTEESRALMEKSKNAVLKLDKSRRIVLQYADMLEKEAAKFKDKDDVAYNKMMEVVGLMRGAWGGPAKGKDAKKDEAKIEAAITARFREFYGDRKSTRLNSSHNPASRMPSSA
jgi:tetratricopeptide (TPR) repeat protein